MVLTIAEKPEYKKYLVLFMSYKDTQDYPVETVFTQDQLAAIRPADIEKWMCMKVYGTPTPGPEDNPNLGRSSSLEFYKKALSYYMVNRLTAWNEIALVGNPTRSVEVNNLIKRVKKKRFASRERRALHDDPLSQLSL
jgi:hypothetical protein